MPGLLKDTKSAFIEHFLHQARTLSEHIKFDEVIDFSYLTARSQYDRYTNRVKFFLFELEWIDFEHLVECVRNVYLQHNFIHDYVVAWFSQEILFQLSNDAILML